MQQSLLSDGLAKALKSNPHLFSYIRCISSDYDRAIFCDKMIQSITHLKFDRAIEIITCGAINMGVWRTIMKLCSKSFKQTYSLCRMSTMDKYWGGFMTVIESYGPPSSSSSAHTYLLYRHGKLSTVSSLSVIPLTKKHTKQTDFNNPRFEFILLPSVYLSQI